MREALAFLDGAPFLHVSLDLDAVDPMFAPGVGTPVRGGLSYREAHLALELVAESGLLDSLELVEVNPILDEANETAALAVELAASRARRPDPLDSVAVPGRRVVDAALELVGQAVDVEARPGRRAGRRSPRRGRACARPGRPPSASASGG